MHSKFSFFPCRKAGARLLAWALTLCVNAVQAGTADLATSDPGLFSLASVGKPHAVTPAVANGPGTPYSFSNPGNETIIIGYNASSAQPAPVSSSNALGITTVVAGDVVFLSNPAGTDDPSNWAAVFRFLNPNDPTGANGLPANEVEGFDASNAGPDGFANFQLFPDTIYLANVDDLPSGHIATSSEIGDGSNGLLPGQTAIFLYTVDVTGSGVTGPGGGSVPEPSTFMLIGLGVCALIAGKLRHRGRARV